MMINIRINWDTILLWLCDFNQGERFTLKSMRGLEWYLNKLIMDLTSISPHRSVNGLNRLILDQCWWEKSKSCLIESIRWQFMTNINTNQWQSMARSLNHEHEAFDFQSSCFSNPTLADKTIIRQLTICCLKHERIHIIGHWLFAVVCSERGTWLVEYGTVPHVIIGEQIT